MKYFIRLGFGSSFWSLHGTYTCTITREHTRLWCFYIELIGLFSVETQRGYNYSRGNRHIECQLKWMSLFDDDGGKEKQNTQWGRRERAFNSRCATADRLSYFSFFLPFSFPYFLTGKKKYFICRSLPRFYFVCLARWMRQLYSTHGDTIRLSSFDGGCWNVSETRTLSSASFSLRRYYVDLFVGRRYPVNTLHRCSNRNMRMR